MAIWYMRVECWISKDIRAQAHASAHAPTHAHARTHQCAAHARTPTHKYLFHRNSGYVNASQCYVIRTLAVLLGIELFIVV